MHWAEREIEAVMREGYDSLVILSNATEKSLRLASLRAVIITKLQLLKKGKLVVPSVDTNIGRSGGTAILQGVQVGVRSLANASSFANSTAVALRWTGGIAAGVVWVGQCVYHAYHYFFKKDITKEQLLKFVAVDAASGGASLGGGVGVGILGAAAGTMILPGVGTLVGGIIGAIMGGTLSSWFTEKIARYLGNKLVDDEEHFKKAQQRKQYLRSLKKLTIAEKDSSTLTPEVLEHKAQAEYQKFQNSGNDMELLACFGAYLCMQEKKWGKDIIAEEEVPSVDYKLIEENREQNKSVK